MIKLIQSRACFYWIGSTFFLMICALFSCSKENVATNNIQFVQPTNFPLATYNFSSNPITNDGFKLGRTLFYDGLLSSTGDISCGSCHQQSVAFAHADHALSHGVFDRLGKRNAPALQNLAFYKTFMWDGGVFNLDLQPIAPIENHVEMGEQLNSVLSKLNQSSKYKTLFKNAFGNDVINNERMLKALSQFMVVMVSANSKYDKYVRNENTIVLTGEESEGLQLFKQKCQSCHATDLFTNQQFINNGLPPSSINDMGRYDVTLNDADKFKFKVPSLRNVVKTAPYMHDGRFKTLDQVLEHYNTGVMASNTLDARLNDNGILGIALNSIEKQKIISFLKTLSDEEFINNKNFTEQ